MIIPKNQYR